jgi:hypothetical protein
MDEQVTTEAPVAAEQDYSGVKYIFNLVAMYLTFFISFAVIAWFGIFSEV